QTGRVPIWSRVRTGACCAALGPLDCRGLRRVVGTGGGGGAVEAAAERAGGLSVRCQGLVHLYKTFEGHDVVALQGVDLSVDAGERRAFLAPSGSGKSTLLTLFGGIQRPSAGRIFLGDEEISRMREREPSKVRASRVSTMLQGATRTLLAYATAKQNLRFSRAAS